MEETATTLRFIGDWPWLLGVAVALAAAAAAWFLYYRESRSQPGVIGWLLPTLRSLAILLVILLLIQPVLRHEKIIRQLGKLFVIVDSSRSMELDDSAMPVERKAAIMESLGLLPDDPVFDAVRLANRQLRRARALADTARIALGDALAEEGKKEGEDASPAPKREPVDLKQVIMELNDALVAAEPGFDRIHREAAALPAAGDPDEEKKDRGGKALPDAASAVAWYRDNLLKKGEELEKWTKERQFETKRRSDMKNRLKSVSEETTKALQALGEGVTRYAGARFAEESDAGEAYGEALARFDEMSRWERLQRKLLGSEDRDGLLGKLAEQQDIELIALNNAEQETLWWQRRAGKQRAGQLPDRFERIPDGRLTDLADAVRAPIGSEVEGAAVLLLSDGQHNADGSPEQVGGLLGKLGVPVFTVGFGTEDPLPDIALSDVTYPSNVFIEDRVHGQIKLRDSMPNGGDQRVQVLHDGKPVWETVFEANGSGQRSMEFDFPVKDIVTATLKGEDPRTLRRNMPLGFEVAVSKVGPGPEEKITDNNKRQIFLQALTHKRRALLIDTRPRWEARYLKNLFQRDESWEINPLMELLAGKGKSLWRRGDEDGQFPDSREELLKYDLVILGDVSRAPFRADELVWLREFVDKRGGGMILLDGQRGLLAELASLSETGPLVPVYWPAGRKAAPGGRDEDDLPEKLELTEEGRQLGALRLVPADAENQRVWGELRPPHWAALAVPQKGAQVLATAVMPKGNKRPLLVWRRVGAGQVLYVGSDEFWRMRYNVGERWHQRFWMQIANWIGEPPFAVEGKFVSIDANKLVYQEGEPVEVRVRLRDGKGAFIEDARLSAVFYQNGVEYAEFELETDDNGGGVYRGRSGTLPPGDFDVAVRKMRTFGEGPEFDARMQVRVEEGPDREMEQLHMNQPLLAAVAETSGGKFFQEEDADEVSEVLKSFDRKEVIPSETELWSSYWWFVPVILLLGVEWALRKKAGFV